MKLDVLRGTVEEIIFQNEANGYTVCSVCCERILHTVVGCLPDITPGETLNLTGKWTSHSEYGEQFKVEYYERVMPSTQSAILAYLSSGIIKGIRAATALKIVERFGCETLDVIANQPGRLAEIKGISKTKAAEISAAYVEKQSVQSIVMFLQKYGVSSDMAVKVHKTLGPGAIDMITKDPYVLCEFISGISFKTSDRIAKVMGLSKDHFGRIRSGIKFVLQNAGQSGGHTFLPRAELCRACCGLLEIPAALVENQLVALCVSGAVVEQDGCCYLKSYFEAETGVCARLSSLAQSEDECDEKAVLEGILQSEQEAGITLSAEQRQAVQSAAGGGVLVITGGPGTGKTTIIKAIIRIFQNQKLDVALCAPTGRAAKRMTQMCGVEAKTCHRLLEVGYGGEAEAAGQFARDAQNPLDAKAVIVDEASMVDIFLMHSLLKALKPQTRLILVGDSNQLPSVGPGNVLKDIIASGAVKVCRLTEIYRQAAKSMIVVNAHRVQEGEYPLLNQADKDFFLVRRETPDQIVQAVIGLCQTRLPRTYGFDAASDIQVLSPVRKTPTGVISLNHNLQLALNPPSEDKAEKSFRDYVFREGDKVMQVKNNYDIVWTKNGEDGTGVFNGDIGFVEKISSRERTLTVLFDDERRVVYDFIGLDELEPAYAVTVHKSQGSEFPCVVLPMYPVAPLLMTRNLFYTAVTRAKKLVVLVGRESAMRQMVDNDQEQTRYSLLRRRLEGGL